MLPDPNHFLNQIEGAVIGFAVADALGVPVEFTTREELKSDPVVDMRSGGSHEQPAGTWSDDTSMTLCMMHSLIEKGIDYEDQMSRFADWAENARYTATGEVFDMGGTTIRSIRNYLHGKPALKCGETSDTSCGNGSLMRIMPLAFYLLGQSENTDLNENSADIIHKASDCTHAHKRCEMACGIYCSVIFHMCQAGSLSSTVMDGLLSSLHFYRNHPAFKDLYPEFASLESIGSQAEDDIKSGGYVIHTLQAAIWCLLTTNSYTECVLRAVNLGKDTDTTAAVAGALAGLWYGPDAIPVVWKDTLAKYRKIKDLSDRFANACLGTKEV